MRERGGRPMLANNENYLQIVERIKQEIAASQQRAVMGANAEVVRLYWRVGSVLNENSRYGRTFIDSLARDIRLAFPKVKGFSARSMWYMQKFANEVDVEFCNSCCRIPWGHITHLLDKTKPGAEREWYVRATIENGWSRAVLMHEVEMRLYERQVLAGKVSNFERTLPSPRERACAASTQGSIHLRLHHRKAGGGRARRRKRDDGEPHQAPA